jgi:hypothetical protein
MISQASTTKILKTLKLKLRKSEILVPPILKTKLIRYAKEYTHGLDLGHNFNHLVLTHNIALKLLYKVAKNRRLPKQTIKQIRTLIVFSSLLHDCASPSDQVYDKEEHCKQCSKLSYKKLVEWKQNKNFAKAISQIINTHDSCGFRLNFAKIQSVPPYTQENIKLAAKILYDSDHLQTIGLFGVMRGTVTQHYSLNTPEEYTEVNEKQISKLKLGESHQLVESFGQMRDSTSSQLEKKLEALKKRIENI